MSRSPGSRWCHRRVLRGVCCLACWCPSGRHRCLPGGLGTLEELFEIIVGKQLRFHAKPIILLNIDRFFDPLLALLNHGIEQKFIKPKARELFFVAENVDSAIEHIRTYNPPLLEDKWFEKRVPSGLE